MNVSDQMRVAIARSKITKSTLAERMCVTKTYISLVLSGSRQPSLDFIIRFSIALKCNIQIDYRDYIDTEDVKNAD